MISVTGITGNYIVQPELIEKHRATLDWLSASVLWKSELVIYQKILDERAQRFTTVPDKQNIDHFQNLIIYYGGEVVDMLRKKLRDHENHLARMLESKNESYLQYYKEHDEMMDEASTFSQSFKDFRGEYFRFIGTAP